MKSVLYAAVSGIVMIGASATTVSATTVTRDLDITVPDTISFQTTSVDINEDGLDDVRFSTLNLRGQMSGLISLEDDPFELDDPFLLNNLTTNASVTNFFTNPDGSIMEFFEGDTVQYGLTFDLDNFATLFDATDDNSNGFIEEEDDSGFIGFEIQTGETVLRSSTEFSFESFSTTPEVTFGFINVTNGSIVLGQAGYNTQPFQGAVIPGSTIPTVPLPASVLLLGAGLAGLGLTKRRRA